jgi:hypothetical protein
LRALSAAKNIENGVDEDLKKIKRISARNIKVVSCGILKKNNNR